MSSTAANARRLIWIKSMLYAAVEVGLLPMDRLEQKLASLTASRFCSRHQFTVCGQLPDTYPAFLYDYTSQILFYRDWCDECKTDHVLPSVICESVGFPVPISRLVTDFARTCRWHLKGTCTCAALKLQQPRPPWALSLEYLPEKPNGQFSAIAHPAIVKFNKPLTGWDVRFCSCLDCEWILSS